MRIDKTLLEKDSTPTVTELKAFFKDHDFSTQVSRYDPMTATGEQNSVYIKAKKYFQSYWNEQMKILTGKGSLVNFSSNAPVRCLKEANENLIAGAVMEIIADETLCSSIIDSTLTALERNIISEVENYARTHDKTVEELTEEEMETVFDQFANHFLSVMMNKLMRVESVPEIMDLSGKIATHEDFAKISTENYDEIDFKRKWDHTRTKIGMMESLDQIEEQEYGSPELMTDLFSGDDPQIQLETSETIKEFYSYIGDDIDVEIFKLNANGYTQKQIAERLGFKTHSAVGKRLKKIEEKRQARMK